MRKPRVVFVDHVARLSGGEIALLRLLPALQPHVDIHVVLGEDGPLRTRLEHLGIETEVLPLDPRLRDMRKATIRAQAFDVRPVSTLPSYVLRLARRLRALDADLVHTNSLKAHLYGGAAGRLARIPVIWHMRDRVAADYLPTTAVRLVRRAGRILPSAVVANSQSTLETLPRVMHGRVLYNPVLHDAVELPAEHSSRPSRSLTIGLVGRLAPWKGQHVFLEAFARAFGATDVHAHIVGDAMFGEDTYRTELELQAERLGVGDQIRFHGFRDDIWAELAELDVLVHASIQPEPFGQVVLEGMAAGLPVVATAAGGPAELITDGVDGLLTPLGDVAALAAALRRLGDDESLRRRLGAAGRRRSSEFTPARAASQLLDIYRTVLGPDRVPVTEAIEPPARPSRR